MQKDFDQGYEIQVVRRDPATGKPVLDQRGDPVLEKVIVRRSERMNKDRTFRIGGEDFQYRPSIAPEAIARWSAMVGGEMTLKDETGKPVLDHKGEPISTLTEEEALAIFDDTVLAYLEPGQDETWKRVRDRNAAVPISLADLQALVQWLFEEQSGRPTTQRSGSSNGSGSEETGTRSTDGSSSPEAVVSTT